MYRHPQLGDHRPVSWDAYSNPGHVDPLGGFHLRAAWDQDWDDTVATSEDPADVGVPLLQVARNPTVAGECDNFGSMVITTDQAQVPSAGTNGCTTHNSVARNVCMPKDATGGVVATSPEEAHLFEAYVQAFCAMDAP
jgi:hypothetical protein